ncbi:hypothetical protein [Pseudaquidulcibacter saccharophilus]|uniref:hypothetical protein n=1 Tax=Pseudaquidulcibacter saccharophilus TaxID=2831900 RepID=UPI001EFF3393|nr:hypothetical protein [Pseudaquidulcibacter saccharophilus]
MFINLRKRSVIAFFFGLLVSGCDTADKYEYNYKITVSVEANGRTYSGSTIQQIINYKVKDWATPLLGLGGGDSSEKKGEAVVVNVDGKYLFLLFTYFISDDPNYRDGYSPWRVSDVWETGKVKSGDYTDYRYRFVTFTDVNDPYTVKAVMKDNIEQYFGEGVEITSIEVAKTNEPATYGQVEQVIPWIRDEITSFKKTFRGKYFTFDTLENEKRPEVDIVYRGLSFIDFIKE